MRALRVDKMTYAALEATLQAYARGEAPENVPVARMIALPLDAIEKRARAFIGRLVAPGVSAELEAGHSTIGGGSAPGSALPTWLVALSHHQAERLERALRTQDPPVISRIQNDRVVLDLRTVAPELDEPLADLVVAAIGCAACPP
jgi:L-seryl-tRNA(Ser) seleniumtransferase